MGQVQSRSRHYDDTADKVCVRTEEGNPCKAAVLSHAPGEAVPIQLASRVTLEDWTAFLTDAAAKVPQRGLEAWFPPISLLVGLLFVILADCSETTSTSTTSTSTSYRPGTSTTGRRSLSETAGDESVCANEALRIIGCVFVALFIGSSIGLGCMEERKKRAAFDSIARDHREAMAARGE